MAISLSLYFWAVNEWIAQSISYLEQDLISLDLSDFENTIILTIYDFRPVFDLETIPIFHPHYHTHSVNTSRPVNLAVVHWLVSNEDENEHSYDNGNEIED